MVSTWSNSGYPSRSEKRLADLFELRNNPVKKELEKGQHNTAIGQSASLYKWILRKTEYLRCLARVGKNGSLRHEISNREALIRDSGSEEEYQSRRGRLEVIKRDRY
jgi:hypothetical protein